MSTAIRLYGSKQLVAAVDESTNEYFELEESFEISQSRAAGEIQTVKIEDDRFVELVFSDNSTWFGDNKSLKEIFPELKVQSRSLADAPILPVALVSDDASRSLIGDIALKFFRKFVKKGTQKAIKKIAEEIEERGLTDKESKVFREGLYTLTPGFDLANYKAPKSAQANTKPYLLFIHGTSSSTKGAFGELKGSKVWDDIVNQYGNNILAFEHRTLTVSPFKNVNELLQALPANSTFDIVTHSRGGLVGELLMRFSESEEGFMQESLDLLKEEGRDEELRWIDAACTLAAKNKIKVGRFIRVACTARGTSLLSERTDIFINTLINLINVSGPILTPLVGGLKMLISETIDSKNSFDQLPGLEAQRPDSTVIKALNTYKAFDSNENPVGFDNRLAVISGNGKLSLSLNGLKIVLTKFFFKWKENDLIVDTASMYQGAKRQDPVQYYLDHNPNTNHFNYFLNQATRDALKQALFATTASIPTFKEVQGENFDAAANRGIFGLENGRLQSVKPSGKKPIVVLLPGIMGSFLEMGDKPVWINYLRFTTGGLTKLKVSDTDNVKATGVIKTAYKDLVEYLAAEYDVVVFPFDWRRPLLNAGKKLAEQLEAYRKEFSVSISLVGHSMGGLVIRDLIINQSSTWKWLNEQPNFRTILLGTPWLGSYRIPHVLSGKDSIIKQLNLIDFAHNKRTLINMFSKFPGLLDLLPIHDSRDFGSKKIWEDFITAAGLNTEEIPPGLLKNFVDYTKVMKANIDNIDYNNIVYVAGKDKETVKDYKIENDRLQFYSTAEGDQSVTWASGIPAKIDRNKSLYYTNATHGGLSKKSFLFQGIMDILKTGSTVSHEFSRVPLPVSENERSFESKEKFEFETSEAAIETGILGLDELITGEETNTPILNISVSSGDLMFARYPVMIGHFAYDDIYNAEDVANTYLKDALHYKHKLALYPGPIGSSECFPSPDESNGFPGCVIVGLGLSETLNVNQLTLTIEKAVSDYLLTHCKNDVSKQTNNNRKKLGLSTLLIGAGYAGMAVESACRAIIKGVINANQSVISLTQMQDLYINELEFIELYEDKSISCFNSINSFIKNNLDGLNIGWTQRAINRNPGVRKRLFTNDTNAWWQRLCILSEINKDAPLSSAKFSFYSSTNNAREEKVEISQNVETLEDMIEDISTNKQWTYEKARSLFEILIPSYVKETIKRKSPILWVLDEYAASFPLELLQTGPQNEKPLCISAPMIRQLATSNFDPIVPVKSNNAIVIGDPDLDGFEKARQLPGAAREAREVYNLLTDPKYGGKLNLDKPWINASHTQILFNLYKQDYKIIHIAAHGFFNEKNNNETGIVIGRSKKDPSKPHYITPANIAQLPGTPELVFINCCFLGKVNAYAEEYSSGRGKMAANIGTQLIQKGVKAVVVAGWEVDDAAALAFAKKFYETMLNRRNFGDAVHVARQDVYKNFPNTNTWGAFQCYGQPQYKLEIGPGENYVPTFDIPQEAENKLENIISKSEVSFYTADELKEELYDISKAIENAKFKNPSLKQLEAKAYVELNELTKAIEIFNELFKSGVADFNVTSLEIFQNISVKQAIVDFAKAIAEKKVDDKFTISKLNIIKKAVGNIEQLLAIWETSDRYSIIGSSMKRRAWIMSQNLDRKKALDEMNKDLQEAAKYYFSAYHISQDSYTFSSWLSMVTFLGLTGGPWKQPHKEKRSNVVKNIDRKFIDDAIQKLKDKMPMNSNQSFWDLSVPFDILLCQFMLDPSDVDIQNELLNAFKKPWKKTGSINKKARQKENIDILIYFAGLTGKKEIEENLRNLKTAMEINF